METAAKTAMAALTEEESRKHADYIYIVSEGGLIISMTAELDHHLADEMRGIIDEVIDTRGVTNVIFDFAKIGFMDSAGIGLIMGRYKKVMGKGNIYVTGAGDAIQRILLISGLHKIVVSCKDVNEAVRMIRYKESGEKR